MERSIIGRLSVEAILSCYSKICNVVIDKLTREMSKYFQHLDMSSLCFLCTARRRYVGSAVYGSGTEAPSDALL